MNLDKLLLEFANYGFDRLILDVSGKDLKILKSLTTTVLSPAFLTANQGRLLEKVLTDNKEVLSKINDNLKASLETVSWSRPFRVIEQVRRLYSFKDPQGEAFLAIEHSPHSQLRKVVNELFKNLPDSSGFVQQRNFILPLTEKNLVVTIEKLRPFKFDIQDNLKNHYETIKSWNFDEIREKYVIHNISKDSIIENLSSEIGPIDQADECMINDRKTRFNFFIKNQKKSENSLKNLIVNRDGTDVWIDNGKFSLEELIKELQNLNRLPILFVIDSHVSKVAIESLKKLEKSLKNLGIENDVGIHFRLDNHTGKEFNEIISKNQYNAKLTEDSLYVAISQQKLPKFFLKSPWQPMSVIGIDTRLRHSKTAVYANRCDLVIEYTSTKSIMENRNLWLP